MWCGGFQRAPIVSSPDPPKALLPWHVKGRGSSSAPSLDPSIVPPETHVQAQIYVRKILLDNFVIFMHTLGGVILDDGFVFLSVKYLVVPN